MSSLQKQCGGVGWVCIDPKVHLIVSTQHPLSGMQGLLDKFVLMGLEKRIEVVEDAVDAERTES